MNRPAANGPDLDPLEGHLVDLAQQGDEDAFAVLVRTHQHRLYRVALRLTGNAHTAEDVVQDALLQAWQHLPGFRRQSTFSTWVTRIVINRCHNLHRAAPTAPLPEETTAATALPPAPDAETLALAAQRREAVRQAVLSLPFDQRAPLVLTTFAGYTHAEAGHILGISEAAAKVRSHRARRDLANRLRAWR